MRKQDLDIYAKQIGARIKGLRMHLDMTQDQLAEMVGTNARQIWRWESGENVPRADILGFIAVALGVSSDFLLGLKDLFLQEDPSKIEGDVIRHLRNGDKLRAIETIINNTFSPYGDDE